MAWDAGTIVSATPIVELSTKLKNLVGGFGVANWSFVENVPAGTGTGQSGSSSFSLDVFKCAGTGGDANDSGTDWYLILRIPVPTSGTTFQMAIAEDYEGGVNKRFRRHAPSTSSAAAPSGSGFWFQDTLVNYNTLSVKYESSFTMNTTGFSYWLKLTNNGIVYSHRVGAAEGMTMAFLMDSFVNPSVATDACPLMIFSNSIGIAGITRLPGVTNAVAGKWNTGRLFGWTPVLGANNTDNTDFWQLNKVLCTRILQAQRGGLNGGGGADDVGGLRGLVKADVLAFAAGGTVLIGDTMTIDGNTWTVMSVSGPQLPLIADSSGVPSLTSVNGIVIVQPT